LTRISSSPAKNPDDGSYELGGSFSATTSWLLFSGPIDAEDEVEDDVDEDEEVDGVDDELVDWLDEEDVLDEEEELGVDDDELEDVVATEDEVVTEEDVVVLPRFSAAYPPTTTMIITTTTIPILAPLLIACRNLDFLDSTKQTSEGRHF